MDAPQHREERVKDSTEDQASSPPPPPSSAAASPSHEFSFTISFQPPLSSAADTLKNGNRSTPASAVDFSPADDIFLHGHLLPLHLLSHPTSPPRPSDITFENMSLPLEHVDSDRSLRYHADDHHQHDDTGKNKERAKAKTFSSFFGLGRLRKRYEQNGEKEEDAKKKKKGFDMSRLLKKYASLMEPLFFFKGEKEKRDPHRRPYSFSGHSNRKEQDGWRRRKGQFSAPASTRTSPTNSGLLSATSMTFSSSDNSTMEELQSAIQAAIAHCKNSIASKQRGET
ncbi:hypothetical protein GW17_00018238 [Ensete ventricosum]|nr:hypothetical protein GW17_00018238 [Ensete ventricosum]